MKNQSYALPLSPEQEKRKKKILLQDAQGSLNANNLLLEIPSIVGFSPKQNNFLHYKIPYTDCIMCMCKVGINPKA